jgi:Zn finger protein HypA/HybF involved in hydrogenase expression
MVKISYDAFLDACDQYLGWCPHCVDFTREQTEPDAHGYDCPGCDRHDVIGAQDAHLEGFIDIED